MRWKGLFVTALAAAVVAVGFWSAPASANLDNDEVGAALVMPYFAFKGEGPETATYMTVTNGSGDPQILEIRLIDGQEGGFWDVESLSCPMTPNETVLFVLQYNPLLNATTMNSMGGLQCTGSADATAGGFDTGATTASIQSDQGVVFFSLSGPGNALFGDWAVVSTFGDFGFSAGAISFQAGPVANEDDVFVFDGTEYSQFPSTLATNFLYPGSGSAKADFGEFILFTLNGISGVPFVTGGNESVLVKVDFYDQFERSRDANYIFGCFARVDFEDISVNWQAAANPGSFAGHAIMSPRGNSPFHGWIVQGDGFGTWARTLVSNAGNFPTATFNDD